MTTARDILEDCLTFRLNRLSPGETADADVLGMMRGALNSVVDELNGSKSVLFRDVLTDSASPISAVSALLGTAWTTLNPGDEILGASYRDVQDMPMSRLTMEQYQAIPDKSTTGTPSLWTHDGLATVYFHPVPTGQTITLRTREAVSAFADLTTDYSMPAGYRSALAACVAELTAPTIAPAMYPSARQAASAARSRLAGQAIEPAIVDVEPTRDYNIRSG